MPNTKTAGVSGGARRDRTADPLLAKQALSQLSYGPLESEQRYKRKEQRKASFSLTFSLFSDKGEVGGSNPPRPTNIREKRKG